jgi:hypothetical protein
VLVVRCLRDRPLLCSVILGFDQAFFLLPLNPINFVFVSPNFPPSLSLPVVSSWGHCAFSLERSIATLSLF